MTKPFQHNEQISVLYQRACMGELEALKPGNVHIFADGHAMTLQDFIKSAEVSAAPITKTMSSVGQRIHDAVEATHSSVGTNTNLGLILLCAPLIHAAIKAHDASTGFVQHLNQTLNTLTVDDANLTVTAIKLANPAGLGKVEQHDVHGNPKISLLEMMQYAQDRDQIAWQYANNFADILEYGLPIYQMALSKWQNPAWATTALYLNLLARQPDTHISRKYGYQIAKEVQKEAKLIADVYWQTENPKLIQKRLLHWDAALKNRKINPGTTADLTVASLLASALTQG